MSERASRAAARLERLRADLAPELEVLRLLGHGSVARVYLAREPALERLVAVKVLRSDLAKDDVATRRFEREARAAARIRHPNVTSVHRVGRVDGGPFLVMEYIDGRTLSSVLAAGGPLDIGEARRVLASTAHALAAAHRHGIVHRDVRPANIMVEEETDRIVLLDFGIAALMESGSQEVQRLTAAGVRIGDPLRISPEQLAGEPVTPASDVYSLGLLAFEILTGALPGSDALHRTREVEQRLAESRPELDPHLVTLIRRCLAESPEARPRAREVADALARGEAGAASAGARARKGPPVHAAAEPGDAAIPVFREFLQELRRRKVGRVAIGYVAGAFVFLQGAQLVAPALPVAEPDAWYRAVVAVTLAGFPMAMVLSWLFDISAAGIRRDTALPVPGDALRGRRRLLLPFVALGVSVVAAFTAWWLIFRG